MLKRFLISLVILSITGSAYVSASSYLDKQIKQNKASQKYNNIDKATASYSSDFLSSKNVGINLKDPKLITFDVDNIKYIDNNLFNKKIQSDEVVYKKIYKFILASTKNSKTLTDDYYALYKVSDRIIRANNLDYINWRLILAEDTTSINAMTTAGNLIIINSSLLDTFHNNHDALAFIIAHELSHQILGHMQQGADSTKSDIQNYLLHTATLGYSSIIRDKIQKKESRDMEYAADTLGAELIVRAGYDFNKAMDTMDFMHTLPGTDSLDSSHPVTKKRIENLKTAQKYFLKGWINEGRRNYYNSYPHELKISSDMASVIISSTSKNKNEYYSIEEPEHLLKRISYTDYKNGDMKSAIKYFKQWAEISNSFVPNLYLSYCYERNFKQTGEKKDLKQAHEYVNIANSKSPGNEHIIKQMGELDSLK